tara:strand:+ start:426 stop:533 length:108 start_codon:yes stop_codon:yes gene_type:complete
MMPVNRPTMRAADPYVARMWSMGAVGVLTLIGYLQ